MNYWTATIVKALPAKALKTDIEIKEVDGAEDVLEGVKEGFVDEGAAVQHTSEK